MRRGRFVVRASVTAFVAFAICELALRWCLFSDAEFVRKYTWRLRKPERFYDSRSEDEYWLLRRALGRPSGAPAEAHPTLGWLDASIDPNTLRQRVEPAPDDGRRLVLLYGDSFARCMPQARPCFEELLANSALRSRFELLNFGVAGYGIDQIELLLAGSLPSYAERAPIVAIGIFVDEDLDRCRLRFRGAPKPRFVERGGAWEPESASVPTFEEYVERTSLPATSYLFRAFARSSIALEALREPHAAEIRGLATAVLDRMRAEFDAAQVERFFVLFHGARGALEPIEGDWRERFLVAYLREKGECFVSTRAAFGEYALANAGVAELFLHDGEGTGHYSAQGNEVALRAIVDGLEGRFEMK